MQVGIIGAGRTGLTIGYLLKQAGWPIIGLINKTRESSERAAHILECRVLGSPLEVARAAELVMITTPDGVIKEVCDEIAARGGFREGQSVIHMSGALGSDVLAGAERKGAFVASVHPGQSFARFDPCISLEGVYFAIEGNEEALRFARLVVETLRGIPLEIRPGAKPLYHASLCVASNYLVAIMDLATTLLEGAGLERAIAREALMPLANWTLRNVALLGSEDALTGPIARGDVGTVKLHLSGLDEFGPEIAPLYRKLGIHTAKIALRKGTIGQQQYLELLDALGGEHVGEAFPNRYPSEKTVGRKDSRLDRV